MKNGNLYGKILLLAVVLLTGTLAGCADSAAVTGEDGRIEIVCTTFPQYDWTANLIKGNEENISLTYLMENGGDLHSFQPSALDIAKVSDCDLFIYVGGESDQWVRDALEEAANPDMRVINMMEVIGEKLVEEEHVEGMEIHEHSDEEDTHEYDEHVWLSLRNAEFIVENIAGKLIELDSENTQIYRENRDSYLAKLDELDNLFAATVEEAGNNTLLFADRFPFRYFVEDYGLNYYAAFDGCSAETEASFETVAFLANKLDELGLDSVLVTDGSDNRLAQVIIENTQKKQQKIYVFNSLQSVSQKDIESGVSYLSAMEENLNVLRQVLN